MINEAAVPDLMVLSAFPGFGDPAQNPHTFRAIAAGSGEERAIAVFLNNEMPGGTAAVLVQNDDFGAPYRIGFTNAFAGEIVGDASYEGSAADVSSQMALLLEDDPDAIVVACFPLICASAIRSAREAGSDAQFLISSPGGIDALFRLVGDPANLEGTLVPGFTKTIGQTDDPAVAKHIEIMESEGVTPSNFTIMGQLFAELFVDILDRAGGTPSRESFIEAAEETRDFQPDLALTPITFSGDEHVGWESLRFWRAENGQFRPFGEVIPAN